MSIAARRMSREDQTVSILNTAMFGFESGVAGTAVSTSVTAAGDYPWTAVGIGSGASLNNDATHTIVGSMAAKLVPSAASTAMRWTFPTPALEATFRYYVWWDANPTADVTALWFGSDTSTRNAYITITSTGIIRFYGTPVGSLYSTVAGALETGGWTRIEVGFRIHTGNTAGSEFRCAVYTGNNAGPISDSGWLTGDIGAAGITFVRVGKYDSTANTSAHWIDAIAFRNRATSLIGPVAAGVNSKPIANAGTNQSASGGATVTLNGSGSYDPDGSVASYQWTQTAGTSVSLTGATSAQPTFTAPSTAGTLTFSLIVTDNQGLASTADTVDIVVSVASSGTPVDDAGSLPVGSASYSVPSGAVFVATNGNDTSGTGSQAAPYATLTKAVAAAAANGTIVMRAGSYNEGEDTQDQAYPKGVIVQKALTIQNYPNEAVWLDGSVPVTGSWTQSGSTWNTPYDRIYDRSPSTNHGVADGAGASTGAGGYYVSSSNPVACWPDMVFYDGVQLEQVQTLGEVTTGKFFIEGGAASDAYWFQGTKLHIGNNPSGHAVRYANKAKFITITGTSASLTLRGVGIRRYASYQGGFGVMYMGSKTIIENVWVEDISCLFAQVGGASNCVARKVTGRRLGFNFYSTNHSNDMLFDRIDIQQANYAGWNLWGPAVGIIKVTKSQRVTLTNSIISNNESTAFWVDQTVASPRVLNCLFQNNTNRVVDFETSSDAIMANCKVIHNGSYSVYTNDGDTTQVWNCTFAENAWGVTGTGDGGSASTSIPIFKFSQSPRRYDVSRYSYCIDPNLPSSYYTDYPEHQWTLNGFTVCNNIIARAGVNTYAMIIFENNGDTTRSSSRQFSDLVTTINGNVYHWGNDKPPYPWAMGKGYGNGFDIYQTLAAFQTGKSKDLNSTFSTTDPIDSNYQLIDTSLHAKATGLPANIATLIGQTAGVKRTGCFW